MTVRTRFAPSPTGFMHIGNLRTALYAWLFARHNDGKFILRIEDTDQGRYVEGAIDVIFNTFKDAGIDYDEGPDRGDYGPYVQSQRKDIYKKYALQLVAEGKAYYCFCEKKGATDGGIGKYDKRCLRLTPEEIQANLDAGKPYVIRQRIPEGEGESSYEDLVYGKITVAYKDMDDAILLKSDGMPTYNFANVVDDHLMHVTHVLRGNEYLSSTPQYNLLYDSFGWERPQYIHLPPIMKDRERKLSKRHGDANFDDFIRKGYLPCAIVNYIALLGWSSGDNREKMTISELVEAFSVKGLNSSPSIFDEAKLRWLNAEYVRELSEEEYLKIATPWFDKSVMAGKCDYKFLAKLMQPRTEVFSEIPDTLAFLAEHENFDLELFTNKKNKTDCAVAKNLLTEAVPVLENCPWDNDSIVECLVSLSEKLGVKKGAILWCVRIAITGKGNTPGGASEMAILLGKEESLRRINYALSRL